MTLTARAPFEGLHLFSNAGLHPPSNEGRGLIVSERDGLSIATVLVRKHRNAALARCLRENFGVELPQGLRRTTAGELSLLGTAPGTWLAVRECGPIREHGGNAPANGGNAFVTRLRKAISEFACVSDQSDGYAVLRLSGPKVRETLAKLVPVDVHPLAFKVGDVKSTVAGHIGVTLWRLEDTGAGSPVFEISLYRSYASSFWHALSESAADFW